MNILNLEIEKDLAVITIDDPNASKYPNILMGNRMNILNLEIEKDLAVITIDDPNAKVNTLGLAVLEEFPVILDQLDSMNDIVAVVLTSGKKDCFIAGADIEMFAALKEPGSAQALSQTAHALLNRIADFRVPFVAAIGGSALGGGLEVALACRYRIAADDPKTVFGLPEMKLGLLPGGGGTQRLPRQIGLQASLDLLLTGKNLYPRKALKLGLIDQLIHIHGLKEAAKTFARQVGAKPFKRKIKENAMTRFLDGTPMGRAVVFSAARKKVLAQTAGNYPAPLEILDCVREGLSRGMTKGLIMESEKFDGLVRSPESRSLIHLFFGMTEAKKQPEPKQPVKRIGILGAGLMGSGIAQVSIDKGYGIHLKDIDAAAVGRGEKALCEALAKKVKRGILSPAQRDQQLSRVRYVTQYEPLAPCDLVIEAVFEDLDLKRTVLAEFESACSETCIFASNTSSLPITDIAAHAKHPERVIGMHYFSPVPKMPLLEIIVTDKTSEQARHAAVAVGIRQGKTVIVVNDGPGFYTTRILAPMLNEAALLLEEGADIADLDKAMFQFGFPVGPVTLMDEVGIDVGAHVGRVLGPMFEARGAKSSTKMETLYEAGYAGRKNNKGFYTYDTKKKTINREVYSFFGGDNRKSFPFEEIQDRLSLIMVNEAAWCLEENILTSAVDGDLGAILGLGFPPFLGGPFRYLDHHPKIGDKLKALEQKHGPRFKPATNILSGKKFHAG